MAARGERQVESNGWEWDAKGGGDVALLVPRTETTMVRQDAYAMTPRQSTPRTRGTRSSVVAAQGSATTIAETTAKRKTVCIPTGRKRSKISRPDLRAIANRWAEEQSRAEGVKPLVPFAGAVCVTVHQRGAKPCQRRGNRRCQRATGPWPLVASWEQSDASRWRTRRQTTPRATMTAVRPRMTPEVWGTA